MVRTELDLQAAPTATWRGVNVLVLLAKFESIHEYTLMSTNGAGQEQLLLLLTASSARLCKYLIELAKNTFGNKNNKNKDKCKFHKIRCSI